MAPRLFGGPFFVSHVRGCCEPNGAGPRARGSRRERSVGAWDNSPLAHEMKRAPGSGGPLRSAQCEVGGGHAPSSAGSRVNRTSSTSRPTPGANTDVRETSVKPAFSSAAIHATIAGGGPREQGTDRLTDDQQAQRRARDTATPRVTGDPAGHLAVAVDGEHRGGAGEAAALGHDEERDIPRRALAIDPDVEGGAVVRIGCRERGHRDGLGIAHHLEDRVEIVVLQFAKLDMGHSLTVPTGRDARNPRRSVQAVNCAQRPLGRVAVPCCHGIAEGHETLGAGDRALDEWMPPPEIPPDRDLGLIHEGDEGADCPSRTSSSRRDPRWRRRPRGDRRRATPR